MPLCYTVEQLLLLRASPLVCKPDNFPPLEEWMGPSSDQRQKGLAPPRGRLDDPTNQGEQLQKRPTLLDTHHLSKKSSTAAPGDIVLGPPKTAFASANSRNALKSPNGDALEELATSNKRFSFPERFARDRDAAEAEKREGRYNGTTNRRIVRDDREDWQNSRQRRHQDQEEGDGRPKRNGDRDKARWDREPKEQEGGPDAKRSSRDGSRREVRGKFEQPWFRGDKVQDGGDDATKASTKQQEWRRDRGPGRGPEWDRPMKAEQDPEWMDSTAINEPRQAHTQEEFQRWKESMKAAAEGHDSVRTKQEMALQPEVKKVEPPPMPTFLEASEVESGMDKYFAFYGDRKTSSEQKPAEAKAHRKPRFAALFSSQPEDGSKDASFMDPMGSVHDSILLTTHASAAPADDANKADQEHFQRVLQMLAGRSSNNTPQSTALAKHPKDNKNRGEVQRPREDSKSPLTELLQQRDQDHTQEDRSQDRGSVGIDGQLGRKSLEAQQPAPREPTPNRDADLLLRLMQQSRIAQESRPLQASQPEASGSASEPSSFPGFISGRATAEKSNTHPPTFFDDPAISQMQRPEQAPRRDSQQRRPTNGPMAAFFDEPFFNNLRQVNQQSMGNSEAGTQSRAPTLPPGMQRPPGFDHMAAPPPPLSWQNPSQRPQQHVSHNGMNPPPGIPNPAARAMNAAYSAGHSMPPGSHIMQPPHQKMQPPPAQRQRKYTGGGDGAPGYPLGMAPPPPGFMNAPPPPGFPNMPPHGRGGAAPHFPDGAGNGMLPRHLMEMLASGQRGDGGGGGGVGGGGAMPGHYR